MLLQPAQCFYGALSCDNGCFADKAFTDDVAKKGQTISYLAACAHFQCMKAEKSIQVVQNMAWTMLPDTRERWPDRVHLSLWPCSMRMYVYIMNYLSGEAEGTTCTEKFPE